MKHQEFETALEATGMPDVGLLMAYEQGDLTEEQVIQLIQHGIDNDWVFKLQGHYGRLAARLIDVGLCTAKA